MTWTASKRTQWVLAAKIVVTIIAFAVLVYHIDFRLLLARLKAMQPIFAALAVGIAMLQVALAGLRWHRIIASIRTPLQPVPSHWTIQEISWAAQFLGQMMPFVVGDILRVALLHETGVSLRDSFKSMLLDRGFGIGVLLGLASLALVASSSKLIPSPYFQLTILIVCVGGALLTIALLFAQPIARLGARWRGIAAATEALRDMRTIIRSPSEGTAVIGYCLAIHGISILIFWMLARGEMIGIEFGDILILVPLMLLISLVPISMGGWGVREGFVVLVLNRSGVDIESALLLALSFGTVILVGTLPGAFAPAIWLRPFWKRTGAFNAISARVPTA